jgi:membrane-bound lytic murein transglycosylase F
MKRIYIYLTILSLSIFSCLPPSEKKKEIGKSLYEIKLQKKLKIITNYNSIDYFLYKGKPLGFHYEMASLFAEYIDVELELVVSNNLGESFELLEKGEGHILATSLTYTNERNKDFDFSSPIGETSIVLVQKKSKDSSYIIKELKDLKNKTIYIKSKTVYRKTLEDLNKNNKFDIRIISIDNFSTEDLIDMVSKGEIDYTVSDNNIAQINSHHYININTSIELREKQALSWGINKKQTELKSELNKWLKGFVGSFTYNVLYRKYYNSKRAINRFNSPFFTLNSGSICQYDDILKLKSKDINWDWKLLASLMYQESRFDPNAKSWVGAIGLMQIMPETADMLKIENVEDPINNIEAGVRYIKYLNRFFKKRLKDTTDIIPFILASYNVGPGHVLDARRLASKYGKNPDKWYNNTDFFLLNKANPLYYKDNLSRNGYCNGEEPYNYVVNILSLYEHYCNIIKE